MLLDTICNTFGGIVFIALLLAIFSQASGTRDRDHRATAQAEIRRGGLNAKIVQLQAAITRLETQLQTQTASTNS
jgi:predicted Zn-dependent protease